MRYCQQLGHLVLYKHHYHYIKRWRNIYNECRSQHTSFQKSLQIRCPSKHETRLPAYMQFKRILHNFINHFNCLIYDLAVGKPRKSCQSSAVIQNGVVLGAWEVETFGSHCAQTDEPPSGSNWWMFDMERYFTLSYITIWTGDSNSRRTV